MGWAAQYGALAPPALLLYLSAVAWTVGYDTIYALQDARDDAIVGIRSTARLFGAHARLGIGAFYLAAALFAQAALVMAGAGRVAELGWAAFAAHLLWQVWQVEDASPATALRLFRAQIATRRTPLLFAGFAPRSTGCAPPWGDASVARERPLCGCATGIIRPDADRPAPCRAGSR